MYWILIFITQILTSCAIFFGAEGLRWIDTGYGLHPLIAGGMFVVCSILPYLARPRKRRNRYRRDTTPECSVTQPHPTTIIIEEKENRDE